MVYFLLTRPLELLDEALNMPLLVLLVYEGPLVLPYEDDDDDDEVPTVALDDETGFALAALPLLLL